MPDTAPPPPPARPSIAAQVDAHYRRLQAERRAALARGETPRYTVGDGWGNYAASLPVPDSLERLDGTGIRAAYRRCVAAGLIVRDHTYWMRGRSAALYLYGRRAR